MRIHIGSVLVFLLLSFARSEYTGGVSFWQKNFTMTCPKKGDWYKTEGDIKINQASETLEQEYNDMTKGHYHCIHNKEKYHFYVKGKVCENCYELDPVTVAVVIIADVLLTLGVILVVYVRARKRKSAGAKPKKVSSSGPSGSPATSSPDYQTLHPNSRSDPYSTVHRMG
ncbi:T-cell surface glycoprotein CD3 epsilon chain-like [Gadus chalcogrammus]|uniref:T-cell surface glycoprotein CD3 epsilon chain-like n=1 Tax=Gadus chalcogrammus TaxID=1042646 RepID=UPI0024C4CEB1|nr:T-cell surface glycoprotein CD3 epsilon chain-like [Gadus chalcogrammus]